MLRCGEKSLPKVTIFDNYTDWVGGKMGHLVMRRYTLEAENFEKMCQHLKNT